MATGRSDGLEEELHAKDAFEVVRNLVDLASLVLLTIAHHNVGALKVDYNRT